MVLSSSLGFPRIGPKRELKRALERYWSGKINEQELLETCRNLRREAWLLQRGLGIDHIPSGDFSMYDHVLDTAVMLGAVPSRFGDYSGNLQLPTYFAMARGRGSEGKNGGVAPMEMTKWFDTNYHYIVPELGSSQLFSLSSAKPVEEFIEAREAGVHTRPVLLGPVSFLLLAKSVEEGFNKLALLQNILPAYVGILKKLAEAGADWVQIDEPVLALDLNATARDAFKRTYAHLSEKTDGLKLLVAAYFGGLGENSSTAFGLPVSAVHLDLVRDPGQLDSALKELPDSLTLSLGVVDGRNIWRTDFDTAFGLIKKAINKLGAARVIVAPSCSLLHSPVDLELETQLDGDLKQWLSFAKQKLGEIALLARAAHLGRASVKTEFDENRTAMEQRRLSPLIHNVDVEKREKGITKEMAGRKSPYGKRREIQKARFGLPLFPTTTVGSFPQTKEVRGARADFRAARISREEYDAKLKKMVNETISFQEEVGLDVLVHGEFERNDMVEFFGERLSGFAFTKNGWVQSYGSRCVKPPIIYGDVERREPMTVEWSRYAQSLTKKPVKGMLTGPVTILQWSFVRNDQPRKVTCRQIALSIRDEAVDLESAGIGIIQIDEPAIREGLPLRRQGWKDYLGWAVQAFRIASGGVEDATQVHTHMCYSEFNEIIEDVAALDADVISMEASRSDMELLKIFDDYRYPNEIGPGLYDIHSPRVPSQDEMLSLLKKAVAVISADQLWVNPDCGLKTRQWSEVRPALAGMVEAARILRSNHKGGG